MMDLTEAREAIDKLDKEISALLAKRFEVVDAISDYKASRGIAVYDRVREALVVSRLKERCDAAFSDDVAAVYERLFEISRSRQERRRAASPQS